MKKVASYLSRHVAMLMGFGLGIMFLLILNRIPDLSPGMEFALYIAAFVLYHVCARAALILHEVGFLLFCLPAGWRFISFRIGSLVWVRSTDGHIRRGRELSPISAAHCMLAPPPWKEESFPYRPYVFGGMITNLLFAALFTLLTWIFWSRPLAALALTAAAGANLILMVVDARFMLSMLSGLNTRDACRALWLYTRIPAAELEGTPLREMPDKWFKPFPEESMDNLMVASIAAQAAERKLNAFDLPGAEEAIRALLAREKGLSPVIKAMLAIDGAFCELVSGHPGDLCEAMNTRAFQKIINLFRAKPWVLRTRYAEALLKNNDEALAQKYLEDFERVAEDYAYPVTIEFERAAIALVREAKRA